MKSNIKENLSFVDIVVKYGITIEQIKDLKHAMNQTWSQIFYDVAECFDGGEAELNESYKDEAEMIAENTLDADRVTTFCQDMDLSWVYKNPDGSWRHNVIEMGEAILRVRR
jgi:hypothetical protein